MGKGFKEWLAEARRWHWSIKASFAAQAFIMIPGPAIVGWIVKTGSPEGAVMLALTLSVGSILAASWYRAMFSAQQHTALLQEIMERDVKAEFRAFMEREGRDLIRDKAPDHERWKQ